MTSVRSYAWIYSYRKKLNDVFFSKLAFWLTTICMKGKIEMGMVSILLPTIIACVEKLDEKDDIIMTCVDVPVHYVVTIMCHLCHCTHCMCDCTLRLRPTDHAPMTPAWSEPSHRRRGLTVLLSHWSLRRRQPPSLANSRQPSVGAKVRLCARRDLGNFSKMRIVKKEMISGPLCVSVPFVYSYVTLSVSEVD